ncbi:spore gernimation protein GerD [Halobacillus litoralis]|uniref:spore germination lipoprotein GerD n=1 Tax=Halobacillus litoralis TaxID=45668 RepID=UPI001CD2D528|nr:spore germination lipoprotein GerD [Halobacillus litoralis]MCA0972619.1 spore gernimation protein GerD [Halobacillus litoralis]
MSKWLRISGLLLFVFLLSACSGGSSSGEQADYDETKKMVVDILKTDDGKKAITEVLSNEEMQQSMALESEIVSQTVSETIVSEKGKEFWTKLFSDPTFVQGFDKVLQDQQKELMKGLMKDAEYQKLMIELYSNPEMMEQMVTVMQGQKYREYLETTINETLNSPVFQAKMTDTLLKAAEKMSQEGGSQGEGGQSGQNGGSNEGSQGSSSSAGEEEQQSS